MSVVELNQQNFTSEVISSVTPVLVDFWAPWCGPCRIMGPVIDDIAEHWTGSPLKVAKLNVDEASGIAGQYKIMSIPMFLLFKGGQVAGVWRGVVAKETLQKELQEVL